MVLFKSGSDTLYHIAAVGFPYSQPVRSTAIFDSCLLHFVVCTDIPLNIVLQIDFAKSDSSQCVFFL